MAYNKITLKQYVIIPRKPKMSTGKIASQVAHATFMALENQRQLVTSAKNPDSDGKQTSYSIWDNISDWKQSGMCVIVLEAKDELQLRGIAEYLTQWHVPHHLYIDEGLTEIPMGTSTALATGVLDESYQWMFRCLEVYTDNKGLF